MIIHTDGGSRGNPGPGGAGFTTNNIAEYTAIKEALAAARRLGAESIQLFSDSELLVRQLNGQYKVKSDNLKSLYEDCMELLAGFKGWRAAHVPRGQNKQADSLANQAMDKEADVELTSFDTLPKGKKVRLGILLSGGGRTMLNIQEYIDAGKLNAEIVLVISSRSEVKGNDRARKIGLEPVIIRKKDYPDIADFSRCIEDELNKARVDLVIQAGWLCLWRIPKQYENRVMNIHPALLPAFGGKGMWGHHVHEAVLKAGCKVSGCTVHFCNNEYDAGPIIVQRTCAVQDDDDADTLAARVFRQECMAYPEVIRLFAEDRLKIIDGIVKRM
jgi:phosphoribosylglycinamide formyltransferase-1